MGTVTLTAATTVFSFAIKVFFGISQTVSSSTLGTQVTSPRSENISRYGLVLSPSAGRLHDLRKAFCMWQQCFGST